jgi:predicted nucleic acid-binding protein
MKEQAITNEIKKMKKKFQENNYNIKEIILFLEAKTKIAISLNDNILLEACHRITQELKGQE